MTNPLAALQRQAAAALTDIRNAVGDLAAVLRPDRVIDDELLFPVRRLVQGLAGVAELAVGPMVQVVEIQRKFVEGQRNLADQMTAWAQLQHQLADRMMAWAEMQRQVASALETSLAPVSGAADLTRRLLREVAQGGERVRADRIDGEAIAPDRAPEDRAPEDRAPEDRAPEDRAPEDRAPEDRAREDRAPRGPAAPRSEPKSAQRRAARRPAAEPSTGERRTGQRRASAKSGAARPAPKAGTKRRTSG